MLSVCRDDSITEGEDLDLYILPRRKSDFSLKSSSNLSTTSPSNLVVNSNKFSAIKRGHTHKNSLKPLTIYPSLAKFNSPKTAPINLASSHPPHQHHQTTTPTQYQTEKTTKTTTPPQQLLSIAEKYLTSHTLLPNFLAKYAIGDELGSGGFGFVVSAKERKAWGRCGMEVAVKFIFKEKVGLWASDERLGRVPFEIYVVNQIKHANIVSFVDFFEDDQFFYLVTELHGSPWNVQQTPSFTFSPTDLLGIRKAIRKRSSCDLFECIEQHKKLSEPISKLVFRQISSAIKHLHQLGFCHRDIKDENILIDKNFNVKLIDFGSAAFIPTDNLENQDRMFTRFQGTIQYAAPEILRGQRYRGPEAEVWALGCCLYIMLNGKSPFENTKQAINCDFLEPNVKLSDLVVELLSMMLEKDPVKRIGILDVCRHPWLLL